MGDKFTPGPDARLPEAGPHTTLDNENSDKGMPSVGNVLLYQLPPVDGLAYSRPLLVTSIHSQDQRVSGKVFTDQLDDQPDFNVHDVAFGQAGQANTWHWPVRGYTGRSDAPGLTRVDDVAVIQPVSEGNTAPLPVTAVPKEQVDRDLSPADENKDGVVSRKEGRKFKRDHPQG